MSWQPPSEDWQSALQQPEDWQKQLRDQGTVSKTAAWRSPEREAAPVQAAFPPPASPAPSTERARQPAVRLDFRGSAAGAGAALALGVVGIGFWFLGPFAWYQGARARRAIRRSGGKLGGFSVATIGMVLGILETVAMILISALIVIGILVGVDEAST